MSKLQFCEKELGRAVKECNALGAEVAALRRKLEVARILLQAIEDEHNNYGEEVACGADCQIKKALEKIKEEP